MSRLLAVDPGIRGCGVALFEGRTLCLAKYVENPIRRGDDLEAQLAMAHAVWALSDHRTPVDLVVVEWPQVYQGSKQKGDPRDLLTLAGVDAAICCMVLAVARTRYLPAEWKGQVPGDLMCCRVVGCEAMACKKHAPVLPGKLSSTELLCCQHQPQGKFHNVADAIGIGLKHLGRL
jgi:hypothetical protein